MTVQCRSRPGGQPCHREATRWVTGKYVTPHACCTHCALQWVREFGATTNPLRGSVLEKAKLMSGEPS